MDNKKHKPPQIKKKNRRTSTTITTSIREFIWMYYRNVGRPGVSHGGKFGTRKSFSYCTRTWCWILWWYRKKGKKFLSFLNKFLIKIWFFCSISLLPEYFVGELIVCISIFIYIFQEIVLIPEVRKSKFKFEGRIPNDRKSKNIGLVFINFF